MSSTKTTILLVEDNPGDVRLLREALNTMDVDLFELVLVGRLDQAVQRVFDQQFDVVLLDLALPDANGLDAVTQMLESAATLPIVVLTGLDDAALAVEAIRAGAQDYLVKGQIDGALLTRSLRYAIERRQIQEDRKKLEEQVQHVQKLKSLGVLAGGIAHDFNNILMAILGNTGLALAALSPVSPARTNLIEIEKASRRAADLCKQMLAYSGKGRFVVEAIDLSELVQEMAHMLEVSISKKAVVRYDFADNLPAIDADATQMRQVVMNLITNASEAIGEKNGVISICTGAMHCDRAYLSESYLDDDLGEGVYSYVEVSDTGCGMDGETRSRLFDPFFTTKFTGRGLGLSAVLGIIRGHKGAIKVYSEAGEGATFKALFPAVDRTPVRAAGKAEDGAVVQQNSGTILLVDDDESVRTVGKGMLERVGFDVLTAAHGREAVAVFRDHTERVDCIVLDLTMPQMDGEEAFRELRRIRKDVPIIMSSGYNEEEVTRRFLGKGIAGFIQKPYRSEELVAMIRELLSVPGPS